MNSYTAAGAVTVVHSGTRVRFDRIADLDSPTNPPDGIPGLAAVNSVKDRCFRPKNKIYGRTGMYVSQGGQNSQWVLRRNQPSSRRRVSKPGRSLRNGAPTRRITGPARPTCGRLFPSNAATPTNAGVQRKAASR